MRRADFRINYFHNKTKNIIDRDSNLEFEQFDKQTRTGVELSARFDSGRFFGGLGVLRNIKNEMCDSTFPYTSHLAFVKVGKGIITTSSCNHGGLSDTGYLASALQPRWSIDADLGARFFGEKLETGLRFHFHSRVKKNRRLTVNIEMRSGGTQHSAGKMYGQSIKVGSLLLHGICICAIKSAKTLLPNWWGRI